MPSKRVDPLACKMVVNGTVVLFLIGNLILWNVGYLASIEVRFDKISISFALYCYNHIIKNMQCRVIITSRSSLTLNMYHAYHNHFLLYSIGTYKELLLMNCFLLWKTCSSFFSFRLYTTWWDCHHYNTDMVTMTFVTTDI